MDLLYPAEMTRFAVNRFVVLGRVGMDLYADPPGTRVEDAVRFTAALGGSAGNIAVALARQGAGAALLSCVSDDAVGRYCLAQLQHYGVDLCHVLAVAARNSLAVTETCAAACQVVLYRNESADLALSIPQVQAVDYAAAAALVVTGTALSSEPSRRATLLAIKLAKAAGALTILDLDYRATAWVSAAEAAAVGLRTAQTCDVVIGNDEEFGLIAGAYDRGPGLARDLAAGGLFTIYKRGPHGSTTFTATDQTTIGLSTTGLASTGLTQTGLTQTGLTQTGLTQTDATQTDATQTDATQTDATQTDATQTGSFETPIFPVQAQKPMGAGDGFMGGLLAALAQGRPLPEAVERGAATAALIVAGIGCAPASPDTATLDSFISAYRGTDAHSAI